MDSALGWFGDIFRMLGQVIPRLVLVRSTHGAVKFVRGEHFELGPGLHIWWPVTTEVDIYPVVNQILPLSQQYMHTKDGATVVADGVIVYSIEDLLTFVTETYEAESNMAELAEAGLRQAILRLTLDEINSGRVKLDNRLTREASELLSGLGVAVHTMRLQSCVQGSVLIHAGSMIEIDLEADS